MSRINEELAFARTEAAQAFSDFQKANLSAFEDGSKIAQLNQALKANEAAIRKVAGLEAAIAADDSRTAERIAAEAEAALATERYKFRGALQELTALAQKWDDAVDSLAAITAEYSSSVRRLQAAVTGDVTVNRKLESARLYAPQILEHKLAPFLGQSKPGFSDHLARLVNHLPTAEQQDAPPSRVDH